MSASGPQPTDDPQGGDPQEIAVTVYEPPRPNDEFGQFDKAYQLMMAGLVPNYKTIPVDRTRQSLQRCLQSVSNALEGVPAALSGFHVEEIELSLDISLEGEVRLLLLGGGKLETAAGIRLTLKRSELPQPTPVPAAERG